MTSDQRFQEILETLERQYPGQLLLSVAELSRASGRPKGTLYNRISQDTLEIPFRRIGGKPKFRIHDVARYLAGE